MSRRAAPALLLATFAVLACSRDRTAAAQESYAREVKEAIPEIEEATGLKFKTPPKVERRTKAEVRSFLDRQFDEERSQQDLAGQQILLRRLGLIPDTMDLRRFLVDLYAEQVIGFYDPATKVLYIVDGTPPEQVELVVQHELVHALQDQYLNIDSLQHIRGDDDRVLAAQSVIEGQAVLVPLQVMLGPGAEFPGGWDKVREAIRENRSSMPKFASAPEILQEMAIFPYLNGAEFVRRFDQRFPHEQPFGARMPTSSEQILHPDRFFGAQPDQPILVTLPPPSGAGVRSTYDNDMGELGTRLFLFEHLKDQAASVRGATGWAGDRYAILQTPKGDGVAWLTVWDSPAEATDFAQAAASVISKRFGAVAPREAYEGKVYSVRGRTLLLWIGVIAGHASVLYVDVPEGVNPALIDPAKVKLR
ncbi:MAG TPA: hypothetical protein VEI06_03300 [Gemmatimonadaceae bacterium]|nr:hypothetical protein [Gemmatimonadaceae bacterium]